MRRELLEVVRCPACRRDRLALHNELENGCEVRSGILECLSCGSKFPIRDGVVELLPSVDTQTLRERDVRDIKVRDWAVEGRRPYVNDNTSAPWRWPAIAANVEQGLHLLSLEGALALDIGAATCWSTRMMCERGAHSVALDISTGMLRDGEAQFAAGVYFDRVAASMNDLPFLDETFDVVFASATIHHSDDLGRTLGEMGRVLKLRGRLLVVNEPVFGFLNRVSASRFAREETELGMNEHVYYLKDYLNAAQTASLQTRTLVPASLEGQLSGKLPRPNTAMMKSLQAAWIRLPVPVRRFGFRIGGLLFGLPLVMISRRNAP